MFGASLFDGAGVDEGDVEQQAGGAHEGGEPLVRDVLRRDQRAGDDAALLDPIPRSDRAAVEAVRDELDTS